MQLRKGFAYVLILSILAQTIWQVGILISFEINQDYIAQNLCENREKPELHCNGHCQLFKQLEQTQSPQNSVFQKNISLDFEVYCQNLSVFTLSKTQKSPFILKNTYPIYTLDFINEASIPAIFRPPEISLS